MAQPVYLFICPQWSRLNKNQFYSNDIIKLKAEGQNLIELPEIVDIYTDISVFNNQIETLPNCFVATKRIKNSQSLRQ